MIFLCEPVEKSITIIRSKQTNVITNTEKEKVWKEIIERVGKKKRSVEQIKEKWRTVCSTAKLEAAVNRKSPNQTGGVLALPAPSEVTQKIIEFHTDALKRYQKWKGIVLYIFSLYFSRN